jgi:hypothetical protein
MRKVIVALVLAALSSTAVMTAAPRCAEAQTTAPPGRVSALPQGTIGTALLGAEAVMIIESVAGVRNRWVILGSGLAGLVAGGVGGFFIDQAIDNAQGPAEISSALLVVGMGLIIPTTIAFAAATMYRPEEANVVTTEDNAGSAPPLEESTGTGGAGAGTGAAPSSGAPSGGTSAPPPNAAPSTSPPQGSIQRTRPEALVNYAPGRLQLGLPAFSIARNYSLEERCGSTALRQPPNTACRCSRRRSRRVNASRHREIVARVIRGGWRRTLIARNCAHVSRRSLRDTHDAHQHKQRARTLVGSR